MLNDISLNLEIKLHLNNREMDIFHKICAYSILNNELAVIDNPLRKKFIVFFSGARIGEYDTLIKALTALGNSIKHELSIEKVL